MATEYTGIGKNIKEKISLTGQSLVAPIRRQQVELTPNNAGVVRIEAHRIGIVSRESDSTEVLLQRRKRSDTTLDPKDPEASIVPVAVRKYHGLDRVTEKMAETFSGKPGRGAGIVDLITLPSMEDAVRLAREQSASGGSGNWEICAAVAKIKRDKPLDKLQLTLLPVEVTHPLQADFSWKDPNPKSRKWHTITQSELEAISRKGGRAGLLMQDGIEVLYIHDGKDELVIENPKKGYCINTSAPEIVSPKGGEAAISNMVIETLLGPGLASMEPRVRNRGSLLKLRPFSDFEVISSPITLDDRGKPSGNFRVAIGGNTDPVTETNRKYQVAVVNPLAEQGSPEIESRMRQIVNDAVRITMDGLDIQTTSKRLVDAAVRTTIHSLIQPGDLDEDQIKDFSEKVQEGLSPSTLDGKMQGDNVNQMVSAVSQRVLPGVGSLGVSTITASMTGPDIFFDYRLDSTPETLIPVGNLESIHDIMPTYKPSNLSRLPKKNGPNVVHTQVEAFASTTVARSVQDAMAELGKYQLPSRGAAEIFMDAVKETIPQVQQSLARKNPIYAGVLGVYTVEPVVNDTPDFDPASQEVLNQLEAAAARRVFVAGLAQSWKDRTGDDITPAEVAMLAGGQELTGFVSLNQKPGTVRSVKPLETKNGSSEAANP